MNRKEFFAGLAGLIALPVLGKKVLKKEAITRSIMNYDTSKSNFYCSERLLTQLRKEDNVLLMGSDKNAPHEGYLHYPKLFNDIILV